MSIFNQLAHGTNGWEILVMDGPFLDDDAVNECIDAMELEMMGIKS